MRKTFVLLLLLTLVSGQVSASVLGTFPYELEKNSDNLETELRLGVINSGDSDLLLEFEAGESNEYSVSLPSETVVPPGEISQNPEGENWHYVGNGRYVSTTTFSFQVDVSEYREDNTVHIPIDVIARQTGSPEGSTVNPVNQLRSYNYTINLAPTLIPKERSGREASINYEEESEVPEGWRKTENQSSSSPDSVRNGSKNYKQNETEEGTGERGVNSVTYLLVAGVIGLTVYIIKVM